MFFKFLVYNIVFQLILSIIFVGKFIVFDFNKLTNYAFYLYFPISILVNGLFYFIIKYEKKLLSNFKNIIKI